MDAIDRAMERARQQSDARVAELRARGGEPAETEGTLMLGYPDFSLVLRPCGHGRFEVRLSAGRDAAMAWGEPWPGAGAGIHAADLLDALCDAWPAVASPYGTASDGASASGVIAPPGLAPVAVSSAGGELTVSCLGASHAYGREGVVVAQALRDASDILAGSVPGSAQASRWASIRDLADLPPGHVTGDAAPDTLDAEAAWFAARLGLDPASYGLAALDVMGRQVAHAAEGRPEPSLAEWHPAHVPEGLDEAAVRARAARAGAIIGRTPEEFGRDALATRNMDAFQAVFYGSRAFPVIPPGGRGP